MRALLPTGAIVHVVRLPDGAGGYMLIADGETLSSHPEDTDGTLLVTAISGRPVRLVQAVDEDSAIS